MRLKASNQDGVVVKLPGDAILGRSIVARMVVLEDQAVRAPECCVDSCSADVAWLLHSSHFANECSHNLLFASPNSIEQIINNKSKNI